MKDNTRPVIVFNRMFAGKYLCNHIGHEVINLFKSDNGHNYVYIQPYGTYHAKFKERIGYVLLVRGVAGKKALEVLGLATELTDIFNPTIEQPWESTKKYICKNKICYGGASLLKIFVHHEGAADAQNVYLTFLADKVMRPNKPVYLIYGTTDTIADPESVSILLRNTSQAKSSLKQYFDIDAKDYNVLYDLVNNKSLWTFETEKITNVNNVVVREDNIFDICGVDDYELAFSNALAYYMKKYPELVVDFAKTKLNIKGRISKFPIVERETNNVDILLENEKKIVVIENKITSKINGKKVVNNDEVRTQLDKYYDYAKKRAIGDGEDSRTNKIKDVVCYVLTPNYNPINLTEYNSSDFPCDKIYKQIFYSDVYDFLKDKHPEDLYFQEFLKGMEKHTKQHHNDLFEDTMEKFVKQIQQKQS
jgi:hypothetical protein